MTNRAKLARLPLVISQLRRRAGFKSQNAAALAIQKRTGAFLHKSQISHWERGKAMPTLASLLTYLEGLGYSLQEFQDELDRANGIEVPAAAAKPAPVASSSSSGASWRRAIRAPATEAAGAAAQAGVPGALRGSVRGAPEPGGVSPMHAGSQV